MEAEHLLRRRDRRLGPVELIGDGSLQEHRAHVGNAFRIFRVRFNQFQERRGRRLEDSRASRVVEHQRAEVDGQALRHEVASFLISLR